MYDSPQNPWQSAYAWGAQPQMNQSAYSGTGDLTAGLLPQYPSLPNVGELANIGLPGPANGRPNFFSMEGLLGKTNPDGTKTGGWGSLALGAAQGVGSLYMGMKQYGMAKDALKENKRQFNLNYGAQQKTTNSQLEDRQRARVASNSGAYQSVGSYMDQNRI